MKFQKAKLEFATHLRLFIWHLHYIYNYLHSVYIALGTINNLEMISSIWEVCVGYVQILCHFM